MAPAYKLTYFKLRGLGESIRYLFHYGGLEFEDNRISHSNDNAAWKEIKEITPFGQVPLLEHNGKVVNQSVAIQRYVAKQVGLTGKNDWENLEIDAIVDTISEYYINLEAYHFERDPDRKQANRDSLINEKTPYYFSRFEARVKQNNGFLVLSRLTWADVYFTSMVRYISCRLSSAMVVVDLLRIGNNNYPELISLVEKVESLPGIKQWIETRPKSDF